MIKKHFAILAVISLLVPIIFGGVISVPATSAQEDGSSKISGLLRLQVEAKLGAQQQVPLPEGQVNILQPMQEEGIEAIDLTMQRIFIYLDEPPDKAQIAELESMGMTLYPDSWIPPVGIHPTGFIIADMPVDKLDTLAAKDYIIRLDTAELTFEPQNDEATQALNADDVWASSYNGSGVTIAVLDSGLDVTHADIPTPTASKDYYNYPVSTDETIANFYGGTGHGTHVTGSALGRAANTAGSTYNGSAPGADLVFLKIGGDTTTSANTSAMVGALHAAIDTYSADIITMSYGGWDAYHDGTYATAQAVDYAVSQGAVVFISAGNDADDGHHYSGTVEGSSTTSPIQIDVVESGSGYTYLCFNLVWYDGTLRNVLSGQFYDSVPNEIDTIHTTPTESDRGTEARLCYAGPYAGALYIITTGTYYIEITNESESQQDFHLYVWIAGAGSVTFDDASTSYTIGTPADADSAIAVGSYTTRKYWWDYNNDPDTTGHSYPSGQTVNQISTFSGQGPRVDTGAPDKVNIVAPGSAIISCRDSDAYPWGDKDKYYIDDEGPNEYSASKNDGSGPATYYVMHGTSMSSPHAAGVAALILQKNPTWTPAQVRHALESTAADKGDSGYDYVYGWGLVDALAAVNSSLPVTASYSDASHNTECNDFDDYGTENTVYIHATSLHSNYNYRVAYYDGSDNNTYTNDVTSGATGNISSERQFHLGQDVAGTWHVIVCEPDFDPPDTYDSSWSYIISSDSFEVQESAIPEFPTVIAAIVAFSLCAAIYLRMRRKAVPVQA